MKKLMRVVLVLVLLAGVLAVGAAGTEEDFRLVSYSLDENGVFYTRMPSSYFTQSVFEPSPLQQLALGTIRIQFSYDGTDWRIQMHKGRYGLVLLGAQAGVFTKASGAAETSFFSAAQEHYIAMRITAWQQTDSTEHLFTRGHSSWWLDGLVPGSFRDNAQNHREIITYTQLTFPSAAMAQLVASALLGTGFSEGEPSHDNPDVLRVNGNIVHFSWQDIDHGRPSTPPTPTPAPNWWNALPAWLQWALRWIFFGWIWM